LLSLCHAPARLLHSAAGGIVSLRVSAGRASIPCCDNLVGKLIGLIIHGLRPLLDQRPDRGVKPVKARHPLLRFLSDDVEIDIPRRSQGQQAVAPA
jgi:hypothetical protein